MCIAPKCLPTDDLALKEKIIIITIHGETRTSWLGDQISITSKGKRMMWYSVRENTLMLWMGRHT